MFTLKHPRGRIISLAEKKISFPGHISGFPPPRKAGSTPTFTKSLAFGVPLEIIFHIPTLNCRLNLETTRPTPACKAEPTEIRKQASPRSLFRYPARGFAFRSLLMLPATMGLQLDYPCTRRQCMTRSECHARQVLPSCQMRCDAECVRRAKYPLLLGTGVDPTHPELLLLYRYSCRVTHNKFRAKPRNQSNQSSSRFQPNSS